MNLYFLQVILDSARIKDSLARVAMLAAQQKESLFDILAKGGPLMIPLAILLVIAIFVFFER
jgi:biopolymer transport protein ExbB